MTENTTVGTRKDGTNSAALLSDTTVGVVSITTGRTFILTDLVVEAAIDSLDAISAPVIRFYDLASAATAASPKFIVSPDMVPMIITAPNMISGSPLAITGIQNGPQFTTAVSVARNSHVAVSANCIWVGGVAI